MQQVIEKLAKNKKEIDLAFLNLINDELKILEESLTEKLPVRSKLLSEVVRYIFKAGGKRIRPALCFLTAKATGQVSKRHFILAELTELIHTASLVHDDIIDSAPLRRGRETINDLWNDKISVITGDFLFAQASVRLGELENSEIVKIYANVLSDLCDGEIEQYSLKYDTNISWDQYITKSTTKTASLFAAACKSSSLLNDQSEEDIKLANDFGNFLGIAFQIVDDTLDFTSTKNELGKEVGADLKQGIITAPTLFALDEKNEKSQELRKLIESRFNNPEDFTKAINLVNELNGCKKALDLAKSYLEKAKNSLTFVKNLNIKPYLIEVADCILKK